MKRFFGRRRAAGPAVGRVARGRAAGPAVGRHRREAATRRLPTAAAKRRAPRSRTRCAAAAKKAFHEYHLWSRSRIPQVSIFWFSSFMNTTKGFQVFHVKIVVNTMKNFQTSQWNPGHKKKICAVYNEMTYCWFFAKNAAASVHSYGVIYSLF